MLAFRFHDTLFTHVIAANSAIEAERVVISGTSRPSATITQWHSPDAWTKRAIQSAANPCIVDTIPRFVLDTNDGPQYVDIDNVCDWTSNEFDRWGVDSELHRAWIAALQAERYKGSVLHEHVVMVATEHDPKRYALLTRALAGAWGLGPVPDWHAAILPALIALDDENGPNAGRLASNALELTRDKLWRHLDDRLPPQRRIDDFIVSVARGTIAQLRNTSIELLKSIGWISVDVGVCVREQELS